ncbi:MAG: class I SAM-dependent methyltransferase [Dehalococcoidales bacterium]
MTSRFGGYEEQEFIAEFYDSEYEHLRSKSKDVDFYLDCSKGTDGRTLELGCGTGRVLIPTASSGYEITGLDLSPYMLMKCREKLDKQVVEVQQRVKLVQGNMTDFETGETYSLVTIPFRPFQHLISAEEQKDCLKCVNRHLAPDGLFVFDVFNPFPPRLVDNPEYKVEREDLPETQLPDGRKLRRTNRITAFHRDLQYNDIELIYYVTHPDGNMERLVQSFPMRYFFRYEMEHLLELCGFRIVELFGDFERSEFSVDSPDMIFVAEKK